VKIVDWEDFVPAVVKRRVCELDIALQVLVVTICKCSMNPVYNPKPVHTHSIRVTVGTYILNISQLYRPPRPVTGIALLYGDGVCFL
jgi:hypothetical protein